MTSKIFFASNICDDLINLKKLLIYGVKSNVDFILLTNVITPQLSQAEKDSYQHALKFVEEGFKKQSEFVDLQLYIKTFKSDKSGHIIAKSSQHILKIINHAKEKMIPQITKTLELLKASEVPVIITPGQTENIDIIAAIAPEIKAFYLNVDRKCIKEINLLAIGGTQEFDANAPQPLQDIEYFEGGLDGANYISELLNQPTDIFISHAPIKYKTEPGEEINIRPMVNEYLPGHLILTSQELISQFETPELLATGATLIRGGFFGQNSNSNIKGVFWDIAYQKNGTCQALACKIQDDLVFSISSQQVSKNRPVITKQEDTISEDDSKPPSNAQGKNISENVKTALLDITVEE